MSDHELSPEEEAEVSRLLADAAPPVELPEHVAVRLDNVLAGLVAEREEPLADVVPLKGRRWPKMLVAAAAVSLFGFLGTSMLQQQQQSDDAGTAAREGADSLGPADRDAGGAESEVTPDPASSPLNGYLLDDQAAKSLLPLDGSILRDEKAPRSGSGRCSSPRPLSGQRTYLVDVAGDRMAVVALRPLNGSAGVADVYLCGQTVFPVASILVLGAP